MNYLARLLASGFVFACAAVAWLVFGGIMSNRTMMQDSALVGRVNDLWGTPHAQYAPRFVFDWVEDRTSSKVLVDTQNRVVRDELGVPLYAIEQVPQSVVASPRGTDLDVALALDSRRKGLMWYALYDVDFEGTWKVTSDLEHPSTLTFAWAFPDSGASYDGFAVFIDGVDRTKDVASTEGESLWRIPVQPGESHEFRVKYRSRGMDTWTYHPARGTGQVEDFTLDMTTDFVDIDLPAYTMSPSEKAREGDGWRLRWQFERLVTGNGMGMVMPEKVQPGPLAASMSFSAPISLALFMVWIHVLGLLRRIEVHPINHVFLAAAFFAFHLLFGYTVDHLPVEAAFALSAAVSVVLVVSYLRLVVGPRFAFVEAGLAQLLYLVGFSLAHFWEGFTGLTVTVLGIVTLFALMQLTGRIKWAEVLARGSLEAPEVG